MPLQLYNTLTRKKEPFIPIHEGRAGMYVCGPTVYGHAHIGHAKSYVSFDVINRYLRYIGYAVTYVQNITDVGHLVGDIDEGEDKVEKEARQQGISPWQIAQMYERSYWDDMDALNVVRPDISCRATGHILEQIDIIERLIEKGHAYEVNGSVYFSVASDSGYGKLSNRKTDDMEAGARVGVRDEKRSPFDFALWKRADATHLMQWPSPWGSGYPGWHVECSAMSMKYLGESFDIHGGGIENQFPHHECEIAQSECATGVKPFVKYWLHNNMVTVGGKKMGKSMGNASNLKGLFEKFDPLAIRFFILQSHYRSTLEFSEESISASQEGLTGMLETLRRLRGAIAGAPAGTSVDAEITRAIETARASFEEAMNDDFNVPLAIGALFGLKTATNSAIARGVNDAASLQAIDTAFRQLGTDVLGIIPAEINAGGDDSGLADGLAGIIIELRKDARARKDFAASDKIRDALAVIGVVLEDGKSGTTWKLK
jgi:cysteinyl-tRNA synthetase